MNLPGTETGLFGGVSHLEYELDASPKSAIVAAEQILVEAGKPLHYREITRLIIEQGYWRTDGLTPEATISARLGDEIRQHGIKSKIHRSAAGTYALRDWGLPDYEVKLKIPKIQVSDQTSDVVVVPIELAIQIQEHNKAVHESLHSLLHKMEPFQFERLVGSLLSALGFESVEVTQRSADGGIDVRGTLVVGEVNRTHMAVQVKRWKNNVQMPVVQQVRGSLGAHDQGLIITTSDFSAGARTEAARSNAIPVALMNGQQLVQLLIDNDIGVKRAQYDLIDLDNSVSL